MVARRIAVQAAPVSAPALWTYDQFARLEGFEPTNGHSDKFSTFCPAHNDRHTPNLDVKRRDDNSFHFICRAGCSQDAVHEALKTRHPALAFSPPRRETGLFEYRSPDGKLEYVIKRIEPGYDGKSKAFEVWHQCKDGAWTKGLGGDKSKCTCRRKTLYLYNLPAVLKAIREGKTVYVVEGEKKVDALVRLGIVATCCPFGAGKWKPEFASSLEGAVRVVILIDNDKPGRAHGDMVARSLVGMGADVRVLLLPGLGDGEDVCDWLARGGTREKLEPLANAAAVWVKSKGEEGAESEIRFDDTWLAETFARLEGKFIRWVAAWGYYVAWTGKTWQRQGGELAVRHRYRTVLTHLERLKEAGGEAKLEKFIEYARSEKAIRRALFMLQAQPGIAAEPPDFDRLDHDHLLPCEDGTIDLRSGLVGPHDPDLMLTGMIPTRFVVGATCPKYLSVVSRSFKGDREQIAHFQKWAGYLLSGSTMEQKALFLCGPMGTGKTSLIEPLMAVLGPDFACMAAQDLFWSKRRDNHPVVDDALRGMRMVRGNELDEGVQWSAATLKHITGSDTMTARGHRGRYSSFRPTHKIVITANHKPFVDAAAMDRLQVIWLKEQIRGTKHDIKGFKDQIVAEELPGILQWMLEGYRLYKKEGLGAPDAVRKATFEYGQEMDLPRLFADHIVLKTPGARTRRALFDDAFVAFKAEFFPNAKNWTDLDKVMNALHKHGHRRMNKDSDDGHKRVSCFIDRTLRPREEWISPIKVELQKLEFPDHLSSARKGGT